MFIYTFITAETTGNVFLFLDIQSKTQEQQ